MVPPNTATRLAARNADDALAWDIHEMRGFLQAEALVHDVAAKLPFFVPRTGLLMLDWQVASCGSASLRARPRLDMHASPWLEIPVAAVQPTGAMIQIDAMTQGDNSGERQLYLQMPRRQGRAGTRLPLSTGLMRMSIQAHDEQVRFLPVVLRSDLSEDRQGKVSLHLHRLDVAELLSRRMIDRDTAKAITACIAERVLGLMGLPGAGLARDVPMIVDAVSA